MQEREQELKMIHHEDMKAQMTAHKTALQTAHETAEQQLKMQLREAEEKFMQQQGSILYVTDLVSGICFLIEEN